MGVDFPALNVWLAICLIGRGLGQVDIIGNLDFSLCRLRGNDIGLVDIGYRKGNGVIAVVLPFNSPAILSYSLPGDVFHCFHPDCGCLTV